MCYYCYCGNWYGCVSCCVCVWFVGFGDFDCSYFVGFVYWLDV